MAIENESKLNEVIKAFSDAGFIDDVVLIGSWCLSFYNDLFEGFMPSVRTTDIDFYMFQIAKGRMPPPLATLFKPSTTIIFRTA